jgi:uncharacterized repeat protein (TIGR03806 family)
MRRLSLAIALTVPSLALAADRELPRGFSWTEVASGITGATALAVAPDGRVFVCEQTGALRVVKDGKLLERPFLRVEVDSWWERGLIGVAPDPNFAKNGFVYVCYVAKAPYPHHKISRFTANGDTAVDGSELVLLEGDDQNPIGGQYPFGHQGGALHFGGDGKLYVGLGEQSVGWPAQRMDMVQGKILRINPDGSIPPDNPFVATTEGKYRTIWALGCRNPFTFAVRPETGQIALGDVGGVREEINIGVRGANYGWPTVEHGPTADARFRGPIHHYPTSSVTGLAFVPNDSNFPPELRGRLLFADFMLGWIKAIDVDNPRDVAEFGRGFRRISDMAFARDGSLYLLERDAWVIDRDFKPGTGRLLKVRYRPGTSRSPPRRNEVAAVPFPTVLPAPGRYTGPISIRLTSGRPGDVVRHATDGSEPTVSSPIYGDPIPLASSTTLRARVFRDGKPVGDSIRAAYRIDGSRPYGLDDRPPVEGVRVGLDPRRLPKKLSETGLFACLDDMSPAPGLIPYDVNSPLWSDGALKRRWIALPGGATIGFSRDGEWSFPVGTILVKHFELADDEIEPLRRRRLETRLLVVDGPGEGYGATYRWRPDHTDADRLDDGRNEEIPIKTREGTRTRVWSFPSRDECLKCHTTAAGFVLGPKTRQLNGTFTYPETGVVDSQLRTWARLGMLSPAPSEGEIPGFRRLVPVGDRSAPLEERLASYLDANCANCHRPGANIPAAFDARYGIAWAGRKMVDAPTVSDAQGVDRPRVVALGDPGRSMLYRRMVEAERFKMPPVARNQVDAEAAAAVREWIERLGR